MRQFLTLKLSSIFIYTMLSLTSNTQANDSLTLYLTGEIKDKCIIEAQTATSFDFSDVNMHSANLQVDCNQKMSLAIRSDSGGLMLKEHQDSNILVDYSIEIAFKSLNFTIKKNASEIIAEQIFNTGDNIPFNTTGTLTISLTDTFTYSGEYKDILHIDVYPNFVNNEN